MTKIEEKKETSDAKKRICFVIMPISDTAGYQPGHFNRVYEYLFKPAIEAAGYEPKRADDSFKSDYIVVSIVQQIIEADMVLCDLSSRNPNVMYELGMRHSFNKPVTLIKDTTTDRVFDIQGIRCAEYNAELRVDAVQRDIEEIKNAILETSQLTHKEVNSILQLAKIKPAETPASQEVSLDTKLILNTLVSLEKRIDSLSNYNSTYNYNSAYNNTSPSAGLLTPYITSNKPQILIGEGELVGMGESIFERQGNKVNYIGELVDDHADSIFLRQESGGLLQLKKSSQRFKKLTTIPF